ncbi:hypothetical protein HN419_03560 [Candidatus Woesearchaeota archaeon]|jgi:broad specificity phosphatase PhoE|nr:hypothetical protein [Candidatus Woesearchaeota archaeon]MBT3538045.1 hypothetical protein [Candidatus Woesearchaeota archaeon]MBT4697129.1 hypothetical protein [Candidatus Woesearchaeota archaeon]MBT4717120.1 hypothetical protein [Candidatus Woesearchaeota archaeon]MBT7105714.1 hypothetical protein [Candidatus Woesearchaeota archaeon]
MLARAKKILDEAYSKYKDGSVLFAAHNGINLALITAIQNKTPDEMEDVTSQKNTAISIFEIKEDNNHKIILENCYKHLE